jgi:hypothetical protein
MTMPCEEYMSEVSPVVTHQAGAVGRDPQGVVAAAAGSAGVSSTASSIWRNLSLRQGTRSELSLSPTLPQTSTYESSLARGS